MDSIYDVIRFYAQKPIKVTPQASFYRRAAIYRVTTKAGSFGIKRFVGTPSELKFVADFLQHLEREQYPHSPRLWLTYEGDPYLIQGTQGYIATAWHEETKPFQPRDRAQLLAAGRAIARLHEVSRTFERRLARRNFLNREGAFWQRKHRAFVSGYQELCKKHPGHPFTKLLKSQMPQLLDESERTVQSLCGTEMTEYGKEDPVVFHTVCHRDITNPNLLYDESMKRLHLIDFDSVGYSVPLVDLDKFLSNCLNWDSRRIEYALRAYHREQPLTETAQFLLAHLMLMPKEEWFLQAQFLAGGLTKAKAARLTAQLRQVLASKAAKRQAIDALMRLRLS